ncbi:MAG: electron transfer flavoprotein subunit beta/FixA family protein [Thermoplasmata archaeon]|nr:electron transfer flavoprotein subunit beta/FixA family protein [Thermoplasmata archaeon]
MQILVFVKPVPEAETRLRPTADGRRLDTDGVKFVLSGYDESAVEQALLLKEALPGTQVRAVTFGTSPRSEEVLRSALALGCDAATWVEAPTGSEPELRETVRALAAASRKFPAELYLLGQQSLDTEAGMVPTALAAALGLPGTNGAVNLRFDGSRQLLCFDRERGGEIESWEFPVPGVIGLKQAANDPRAAKLQNILKSRKLPIDRIPASELPAAVADAGTVRPALFTLPPARTGAKLIEYTSPEEAAHKLVRILREEAKVFP